jgi:hypothetical protein
MVGKGAVCFNKAVVCGHLEVCEGWAMELLLAGRGGEGKKRNNAATSTSSR